MMKDELGWKITAGFVTLRPKLYAYGKLNKKLKGDNSCKGRKKCAVTERLTFDGYKTCSIDFKTIHKEQMLFENNKHEVYMVNRHKIDVNRDDDKKHVQARSYNFYRL